MHSSPPELLLGINIIICRLEHAGGNKAPP